MKNNNFDLNLNLVEPGTDKSKASLYLGFLDKEEDSKYKVLMTDDNKDPIIIQEEEVEKFKCIGLDFLSKFGSINIGFNSKKKK